MEKNENFTSEITSWSTMVDGGCTLATAPAEFIITKINTSSKKNIQTGRWKGGETERIEEWIRGVSEEDKERRDYY